MSWSCQRLSWRAARLPSSTPKPTAVTSTVSISSSVGPRRARMSVDTGRLCRNEKPRSKVAAFCMYSASCIHSGWSSPKLWRSCAMYSGVAAPASPASTSAASPGASCSSMKLSATMTSTVGTACSSRRAAYANPRGPVIGVARRSARQPHLVHRRVQAERTGGEVLHPLVVDGDEVQLVQVHERAGLGHAALQLVVELGALLGVELDVGLVHQLVGLLAAPARVVDEH